MRIAVPLSPLDPVEIGGKSGKSGKSGEFDDSENVVPAQNSSLASRSVKSTAQHARIREVNASSPRSSTIHSFPCLERTPLSDIDNSAGFSTRSSPAKSQLEFRKREQHVSLSVTAPVSGEPVSGQRASHADTGNRSPARVGDADAPAAKD